MFKVGRVSGAAQLDGNRTRLSTRGNCFPIEPFVKLVLFDSGNSSFNAAQTLGSIGLTQLFDYVFGMCIEKGWKGNATRENLFVDSKGILVEKGRITSQQFK